MVGVRTRRERRRARARLAAAAGYAAMGWPVCAGAYPLGGSREAREGSQRLGTGQQLRAAGPLRAVGPLRGAHGRSTGQPGLGLQGPAGRACSCDRIGCPDPGAHPVSAAWQIEATADTGVATGWWQAAPEANVLLVTGRVFDVLDVPAAAGRIALGALAGEDIGPVAVPGPDRWLFFVATRGAPADEEEWWSCRLDCVPDTVAETPGLRWHCRDSYVLAPPSRHVSGHVAHWIHAPRGGRRLPDSMRILPVLADACEEADRS